MSVLDVARGASAVESVYVIGTTAAGLPQELNFAAHTLVYENRYKQTVTMTNNALTNYNTNEINFLFNVINNYQRLRSYVIGMQFNFPALTSIPTQGTGGATSLTPMFGMGITYWDQIYLQLGSSQQALAPTIPAVHNTYMQKWTSFVDKTDLCIRKWWEMAGFFDVKTFEYAGGIQGPSATNTAASNFNPTLLGGANGGWAGTFRFQTPMMNDLQNQAGFGAAVVPGGLPGTTGFAANSTPVRGLEGGLWLDPQMQRYRSMFYGIGTATKLNYLTKMGLMTDIFESPLCIPGMQLSISLKFNETNAVRKRYINTPFVTRGAAADGVNAFDVFDQNTLPGPVPVPNQFWVFSENIEFRSDIHGAFLLVFTGGKGLTDHMMYYDLYSKGNIINVTSEEITIVQQGNNCPWESSYLFELQYPWQNVERSGGQQPLLPPSITVPPYMYTDVGIREIWAQITTPIPVNFNNLFWQSGPRPNGMAPQNIRNLNERGVTDMWWWYRQMGYETQYFADTAFEDVNSTSLRDWLGFFNQPAVGSFPLNPPVVPVVGPTPYGVFSVKTTGGLTYGQGRHNLCWRQIWNPLGYVDKATDYGVTVGSLRTRMTFSDDVDTPIKFNHLGAYPISVTYLGSGVVTTNIRLK